MQTQTSVAKQADPTAPVVKKTAPPVGDGMTRSPSTHVMNGHDHATNDRQHSESDEEEDRDEVGNARVRAC